MRLDDKTKKIKTDSSHVIESNNYNYDVVSSVLMCESDNSGFDIGTITGWGVGQTQSKYIDRISNYFNRLLKKREREKFLTSLKKDKTVQMSTPKESLIEMTNSNYDIVKELLNVTEDIDSIAFKKLPLNKKEWIELMKILAQRGKKTAVDTKK
jgi:adenylosuccinate synthase